MKIQEAIKYIEFPIIHSEVWGHKTKVWKSILKPLHNLNDMYDVLGIKNKEKTIIDFHPTFPLHMDSEDNTLVQLDLIVGTEADLFTYRENSNKGVDLNKGLVTAIHGFGKRDVFMNYCNFDEWKKK